MTIEKICTYKGIAERDIKRNPVSGDIKENLKIYGYSKCLKCNGFDNNCNHYKSLKELRLL